MAQPCFLVKLKYFKKDVKILLTKEFIGVIIYLEVKEEKERCKGESA